jgi:hypothetical protein
MTVEKEINPGNYDNPVQFKFFLHVPGKESNVSNGGFVDGTEKIDA